MKFLGRVRVETELLDLSYQRLEEQNVVIVEFSLKRPISPEEAKDAAELLKAFISEFVKPKNNEIVAISGRGPIWFYMMAAHQLTHTVPALGTFEPKACGVVVVAVHNWDVKASEGQLIQLPEEFCAQLKQ